MTYGYEINELAKEDSWRMFRIIGELVEGFDSLSGIEPAVTIYGSSRLKADDELYAQTEEIAYKAGVTSVGLNIELTEEQTGNIYCMKSITFHHFFVRKVMLVKYATAFVIVPGGLGTLDELTEVLNLIQSHKIKPFPVILFDSQYWKGFLDWLQSSVLARKFISEDDLDLLRICDHPDEVIEAVQRWHQKQEVVGRKALLR